MSNFPTLPEHYVKRVIGDMLPEDIYYLQSDKLVVDRQTLQPYFDKYTPITPYDANPSRLVGRFGIMRVFDDSATNPLDGYVIDLRFIDSYEIEQDDITPREDASQSVIDELESDRLYYASPLGILANEEDMSQEILLGHESIHPHLLHLCERSNELHEKIAARSSRPSNSAAKARQRKSTPSETTPKPQ
jgi:hypothetical protein